MASHLASRKAFRGVAQDDGRYFIGRKLYGSRRLLAKKRKDCFRIAHLRGGGGGVVGQ